MRRLARTLLALVLVITGTAGILPAPAAGSTMRWWHSGWSYRIAAGVDTAALPAGVREATAAVPIDFTAAFAALGLNGALLDPRSLRVIEVDAAGAPMHEVPHTETYSTLLDDMDAVVIPGDWNNWTVGPLGTYWTPQTVSAHPNESQVTLNTNPAYITQGTGSAKLHILNMPGGYDYPGTAFNVKHGGGLNGPDGWYNWTGREVLTYDFYPIVNTSAVDQAPDLLSFKLYGAFGSETQSGPGTRLAAWNYGWISLNPLNDRLAPDLSNTTRIDWFTLDNNRSGASNAKSGNFEDGDELTVYFDNLRLVDQQSGQVQWTVGDIGLLGRPSVRRYDIYFDTLDHGGKLPSALPYFASTYTLPAGRVTADAAESGGGSYRLTLGGPGASGLVAWSAPAAEKVIPSTSAPLYTAPLALQAARREFEPFQIVLRAPSGRNVTASIDSFTGPGTIAGTTIHTVETVNIAQISDYWGRTGPLPDPLMPYDPGTSIALTANQAKALWFTVRVPADAPPGTYASTVHINPGQADEVTIPVTLEVWPFTLPPELHLPSEWGFGWDVLTDDYRASGTQILDLAQIFKTDFVEHRLIPKGVAWPSGLNYPGGIEYDCNGHLDDQPSSIWAFGQLGPKYLHGVGWNNGVGFPTSLIIGPYQNDAPNSRPPTFCGQDRGTDPPGSAGYNAKWTQYLSALDAYIVAHDYDDQVYYHIVNEPQSYTDYNITAYISQLTHSAAPHLRQMVSEQVEPEIYANGTYPGAKISIWLPTITIYEENKSHDRQVNHGEDVWWYFLYGDEPPMANPITLDHPGVDARIAPWLAWQYRVRGLLYYAITDWSPNPWTTPYSNGVENGDGYMLYPPRRDGQPLSGYGANGNRLVPSIRWELLREGMEDYEYLYLVNGGAQPTIGAANAGDAIVSGIAGSRNDFTRVPAELMRARERLARRLIATDTTAPAAIDGLHFDGVTAASVTLGWLAPGDDARLGTAAAYDVRFASSAITSEPAWAAAAQVTGAPVPAEDGTHTSFTLTGVYAGQTVCVAVKTRDEAGNWSALSNSPCITVSADIVAPAAVTDLAASNATANSIDLTWTAQGDDGNQGAATLTDLRFLDTPISEANWAQAFAASGEGTPPRAGTAQWLRVAGLNPATTYFFALKQRDDAGNWSALSNVATLATAAVQSHFVNFQNPSGQPIADPLIVNGHTYQKAGVEAYDAGRGYGWDYSQGSDACQSQMMTAYETGGTGVNVLQRSILYNDYGRRCYWQYDLPSGTYTVAVGIGWPTRPYNSEHQHVDVEGVAIADATGIPGGNAIFTGTVTIADAQLTLAMGWTSNADYTMLNYIDILAPAPGDTAGPAAVDLRVNGQTEPALPLGTTSANLTVTLSDRLTGNHNVTAGEYFVDNDPGAGHGTPLLPDDGAFNAPAEPAHATLNTAGWLPGGEHRVYVRGRDALGQWTAEAHVIVVRVQEYSLAWGKAASAPSVPAGRPLTFTLTLVNRTPALVSGIWITDVVPSALTVTDAWASAGTPQVNGQQVTWQGSLAASSTLIVTIATQVSASGAVINTAYAGYGEGVLPASATVLVPGQWVFLPLARR